MLRKVLIIISCVISSSLLQSVIETAMKADHLVPDIIPEAPPEETDIVYDDLLEVKLGNTLTPYLTKNIPNIKWKYESGKVYALMLIDPYNVAAGKDTKSVVKHWLVGNIQGNNINNGTVIAAYLGPAPVKNTGFHKYLFLVYQQRAVINFNGEPKSAAMSVKNRANWNFTQFLNKYNIVKLVSGNYLKVESDCYSEALDTFLGI